MTIGLASRRRAVRRRALSSAVWVWLQSLPSLLSQRTFQAGATRTLGSGGHCRVPSSATNQSAAVITPPAVVNWKNATIWETTDIRAAVTMRIVIMGQVCVLQVESWWVASVLVTLGTLPRLFLSWQPMAACKASEISRTTQSINGLSRAVVFRRNEHLRSASDIVA